MKFLHTDSFLDRGDEVIVDLDSQANVMLMDDSNFSSYRRGASFRYYGGHAKRSPVHIPVPSTGHWNVVVDLGGYAGSVRAGVRFIRG